MPFQVVFNSAYGQLPPVVLLSAGEDQFIACGTYVYLSGVVDNPANLPGHSILWEQLEGNPVTLDDPTSISTFYAFNPNDRSTKRFRLWIDKDDPYLVQFKDVTINHTPQSFTNITFGNNEFWRGLPPADKVDCASFNGTLTYVVNPPDSTGPEDTTPCGSPTGAGVSFIFTLTWTEPNSIPYVDAHLVQDHLYRNDVLVQSYNPGEPRQYVVSSGGELAKNDNYYVISEFNISGNYIYGKSCTVNFSSIPTPGVKVYDDRTKQSFGNHELSITYFKNIFERVQSNPNITFSAQELELQKYSNIVEEGVSISNQSLSSQEINIIRYDPGGIGG